LKLDKATQHPICKTVCQHL